MLPPWPSSAARSKRGAGYRAAWWSLLVLLSWLFAFLLGRTGIPAGLLLGPLAAAMLLASRGAPLSRPRTLFVVAQAVVGCMIGSALSFEIFTTLAPQWPLFLVVTLVTIAASGTLGYLLSRWRVIPGTVAIWGSSPGAASAMVLMAEAFGADARLVAVMTYTRVVAVAVTASVLSALLLEDPTAGHAMSSPHGIDPAQFGLTLALCGAGVTAGLALRLPAGSFICALFLTAVLNIGGLVQIVPPRPLLDIAFATVGWRIGLSFTDEAVGAAARALPAILLAAALLIIFCAGLAVLLAWKAGTDLTTAYLATSPGGLDSIAIIAASNGVDVPFVMALQMFRFVLVMMISPPLAAFLARRHRAAQPPE